VPAGIPQVDLNPPHQVVLRKAGMEVAVS
jgi:hypothetical protein